MVWHFLFGSITPFREVLNHKKLFHTFGFVPLSTQNYNIEKEGTAKTLSWLIPAVLELPLDCFEAKDKKEYKEYLM